MNSLVSPRVTLYIQIHDGRPRSQKVALAKALTDACVQGVSGLVPENVSVSFRVVSYDDVSLGPDLLSDVVGRKVDEDADTSPAR